MITAGKNDKAWHDDNDGDDEPLITPLDLESILPRGRLRPQRALEALRTAVADPTPANMQTLQYAFKSVDDVAELLTREGHTLKSTACLSAVGLNMVFESAQAGLDAVEDEAVTGKMAASRRHSQIMDYIQDLLHRVSDIEHARECRADGRFVIPRAAAAAAPAQSAAAAPSAAPTPSAAPALPADSEARLSAMEEEIKSLKKENAELKGTVAALAGMPLFLVKALRGEMRLEDVSFRPLFFFWQGVLGFADTSLRENSWSQRWRSLASLR